MNIDTFRKRFLTRTTNYFFGKMRTQEFQIDSFLMDVFLINSKMDDSHKHFHNLKQ